MKKIYLFIVTAFIFFISAGCVVSLPETFRRTYDEPGVWKSIEVMEGISKDELWKTVVDAISHKFDLEVIEKDSGYIRTSWKFTYIEPEFAGRTSERVSDRYRSRVILKFTGENWNILQVKCESHWLARGNISWIIGYDTALLEDVYGDLQGRIGRIRR